MATSGLLNEALHRPSKLLSDNAKVGQRPQQLVRQLLEKYLGNAHLRGVKLAGFFHGLEWSSRYALVLVTLWQIANHVSAFLLGLAGKPTAQDSNRLAQIKMGSFGESFHRRPCVHWGLPDCNPAVV